MNEHTEHELGNVRARIKTIQTSYGEMRTIELHRAWDTKDGERRWASDLRPTDVKNAIELLERFGSEEGIRSPRTPVRRLVLNGAFPFKRSLSERDLACADPSQWKYDRAELQCWGAIVRAVQQHPDEEVRALLA